MSNPTVESLFLFAVLGVFDKVAVQHEQQDLILEQGAPQIVAAIEFLQEQNQNQPGTPLIPAATEYIKQFQKAAHLFFAAEFKDVK